MANVAFIGLGNMGTPMSLNLVKAGHAVIVFDLVEAACRKLTSLRPFSALRSSNSN